MPVIWGRIHEPGVATGYPAQLQLDKNGLSLNSEGRAWSGSWQQVRISAELARVPRTLTFADGWMFSAEDPQLFNQYLQLYGARSWLVRLEASWGWIALATLVTLLLAIGLYRDGIPWLAQRLAPHVPVQVQLQLGEQAQGWLTKVGFTDTQLSMVQQEQLQASFQQLVEDLQRQGIHFSIAPQLRFLSSPLGPNALALPDGTVVMTDQMVRLALNNQELEAVLLHELGHLHHHHLMSRLVQNSLLALTVALLVGDSSGVTELLSGAGVLLVNMSYSRLHEREADAFAANFLRQQGQGSQSLAGLFQRLAEQEGENTPAWLSSHPAWQERIEALRE